MRKFILILLFVLHLASALDKSSPRIISKFSDKHIINHAGDGPRVPGRQKPARDYRKLVQFANLATVGYCVTKGLETGLLGDPYTSCLIKACQNSKLRDVEIVKIFDFNNRGEVGTGFYALDKKRKTIILVFRGTASRRDWFTDVNFVPVSFTPLVYDETFSQQLFISRECEGCKVHRGFYNFLKDNSAAIISVGVKLKSKYPDFQFLVVGHSLGAALTVLCGIEFQLLGYDPLVVTFGGPKVGNQQFADFVDYLFDTEEVVREISATKDFTRGYIRVVHKRDIVPSLPPYPFVHAGFEYFINARQLPHTEEDLERRGLDYSNVLTKRDDELYKRNFDGFELKPSKLWPEQLGKYEHTHYFRKITSCKPGD
ncbi:uncharacterized protein SPAPADRAFT_142576 [Spathaspora passalidarum NRRL Y-27907]|uniref:triacylglycerol lipase n=1 Tax=Spathaspora passalidarum (strain NRRL Y-27907 / 11-Y1) TaxID=619300 RepID=G3ASW5_SPAPN|nr:uncharacterized protein SPAPADRAFT_142576 [Spathaspora passalidarum NRRL Y-27907]EGW30747.1 hypothetical protein SPAPADRAFT_142576 [Spathaspora passalidarum NRRL Y-27907]